MRLVCGSGECRPLPVKMLNAMDQRWLKKYLLFPSYVKLLDLVETVRAHHSSGDTVDVKTILHSRELVCDVFRSASLSLVLEYHSQFL